MEGISAATKPCAVGLLDLFAGCRRDCIPTGAPLFIDDSVLCRCRPLDSRHYGHVHPFLETALSQVWEVVFPRDVVSQLMGKALCALQASEVVCRSGELNGGEPRLRSLPCDRALAILLVDEVQIPSPFVQSRSCHLPGARPGRGRPTAARSSFIVERPCARGRWHVLD
jgi:hypothetical protein